MRKNDPCFCLVFGKANQSGLLFLIRQANLVRNNPISFSRNGHARICVCACAIVCSEMGNFVHCFLCSALPCYLPFCPYSSTASFLLHCFFFSSSNWLFHDTGDHLSVLSGILTLSFQTATLLSPSCLMQVSMAPVSAAPSSLSSRDTSNHDFPKAQYPEQNCSSPAEWGCRIVSSWGQGVYLYFSYILKLLCHLHNG